jgi:hypothetical protein
LTGPDIFEFGVHHLVTCARFEQLGFDTAQTQNFPTQVSNIAHADLSRKSLGFTDAAMPAWN